MELALLGGSLRPGSVSEAVLHLCAGLAAGYGARPTVCTADTLDLPLYRPGAAHRAALARRLVETLRRADGLVIVTPTYHGGMSGLVKNALDHAEELVHDRPAYLDGKVVGVAAVGWSEHGAATAVQSLRTTVQSLRGWVAPMAVTFDATGLTALDGPCARAALRGDARLMRRLDILLGQVTDFADRYARARLAA
ncbi:NADPH-dependent FMN reductase [Couchioplanes azureus]|uniref:NADPH-dependent FMN reductase n=1 Tax=Couchioplanes caeruleus TaxID=56438 RepID=UPI00167079DF|nr:NAD(P)H-dependent oxidoreductase [Couchioplanes caeruleus]GGQ81148.1 FMN reductase [Couchioplanes caeruleus subsp. azureus]